MIFKMIFPNLKEKMGRIKDGTHGRLRYGPVGEGVAGKEIL